MVNDPMVSPRLDAIARLLWKQFGAGGNDDAQRDVWNVIAQDILRVTTTPPDHVVLPRAEVEALRSRAERLRKASDGAWNWLQCLTEFDGAMEFCTELFDPFDDAVCALHERDLDDNLRPLDDLPPLKLADNPPDERTTT